MKIRADGVWIYGGTPIGRMPLVKLFAGVLRKDADGQALPRHAGGEGGRGRCRRAVPRRGDGGAGQRREQSLIFRTNVDDVVTAGPEHPLRFAVEPSQPGPQALSQRARPP